MLPDAAAAAASVTLLLAVSGAAKTEVEIKRRACVLVCVVLSLVDHILHSRERHL